MMNFCVAIQGRQRVSSPVQEPSRSSGVDNCPAGWRHTELSGKSAHVRADRVTRAEELLGDGGVVKGGVGQ